MGYLRTHMINEMKLHGYSETTIKMYTKCIHQISYHYLKSPLTLTQNDIKSFFISLIETHVSSTQQNIFYSSLKTFFRLHNMPDYLNFLPPPKRFYNIPEILDESEIEKILSICRTLRYKTFFALIYSSGLRISEALNLNISDIDFVRKTLLIRNSKNGKSRYSILSIKAIKLLKFYFNRYQPKKLLFFSLHDKTKKMSKRLAQDIFHKLVKEAHINKKVRVHTLRHSFATHLLEKNTSIFYIMQLLGHSSIRSTLIYLHMQRIDKMNIFSPLDTSSISLDVFQENPPQKELCIA
jgi:integrase/recombinase XerD